MGEDLRRSKLHSVYKRDSVEVSRFEPVPPKLSEEMSSVYEFPAVVDDEAEFKKILGEQTWDTRNPLSIRILYADTQLMVVALRRDDPVYLSLG